MSYDTICWAESSKIEQILIVVEMRILKLMSGETGDVIIKNECVWGKNRVT